MKKTHWKVWHGALGEEKWEIPKCVAKTEKVNRKDQGGIVQGASFTITPFDYDTPPPNPHTSVTLQLRHRSPPEFPHRPVRHGCGDDLLRYGLG